MNLFNHFVIILAVLGTVLVGADHRDEVSATNEDNQSDNLSEQLSSLKLVYYIY